jgi:hypothetical protein
MMNMPGGKPIEVIRADDPILKKPFMRKGGNRRAGRGLTILPTTVPIEGVKFAGRAAKRGAIWAGSGLKSISNNSKLKEIINIPLGPMISIFGATAVTMSAWTAYSDALGSQIKDAQRTGDYSKINGADLASQTAMGTVRNVLDLNAQLWSKVIGGVAKLKAGFFGLLGDSSAAIEAFQVAELISGAFEDRHNRIKALQDAWGQGLTRTMDQGLADARKQSWGQAIRAVQLGFTFGDMLDMDHRIYQEIHTKMRDNYGKEYIKKVAYPRMRDLEGVKD